MLSRARFPAKGKPFISGRLRAGASSFQPRSHRNIGAGLAPGKERGSEGITGQVPGHHGCWREKPPGKAGQKAPGICVKRHQTPLGKQELLDLLLFGWTQGPQGLGSLLGVTGWRLQPTLLLPFICQHKAEDFWGFFQGFPRFCWDVKHPGQGGRVRHTPNEA